jgi:hypothetical protein
MKKAIIIITLGLSFVIGSVNAQETTQRDLSEKLLNLMQMQKTIENSFATVKQMLPGQMEKMRQTMGPTSKPGPTPEQTNKLMDLISQELSWDNLKTDYIALYAETFTADELNGLIAFYESPVGQAYIQKQPELTKRSMALTQGMMLKIMPKMQNLIKEMQSDSTPQAEPGK